MVDLINKPPHYNKGSIEVWDFIEDQQLGYLPGSAIKYICRYRYKGTPITDLDKAIAFLTKLRDIEKAKQDKAKADAIDAANQQFAKLQFQAPQYGYQVFNSRISDYDRS